ncbi:MAG TPA: hypothetical protein EYP56_18020, partial [Planctomycetaceae bacterium]|nr:hypothetical protein [Planctomycetaceae bacterium]
MESLTERASALSPAKRAVLERLLRHRAGRPAMPPLIHRPDVGPVSLSLDQERLWFLDQIEPGNPAYKVAAAIDLEGRLEATLLERCIQEVVRRHAILRTGFRDEGGRPVQVVTPHCPWAMQQVDLRGLPAAAQQAEAERLAAETAR